MVATVDDTLQAIARIELGGDCLSVEAKTASEFSPLALGPTLCAFANLPGGGTLLLGVDERQDDLVVGVPDAQKLAQQVTNFARNGLSVPLSVETDIVVIEGKTVVTVEVHEAPINDKPVDFRGTAYLRQYDGDYTMSQEERQQLLRRHERPRDDACAVPGTSRADLDEEAVAAFCASVRSASNAFRGVSDEEVLRRLNVITAGGELTVAGLYTLGVYPQQFLPHLSLTAAVVLPNAKASDRATNRMDFTGPLPRILEDTVDWVARNVDSTMIVTEEGKGLTRYAIPLTAVREVVANALVHRDLSDAASGRVVELRLTPSGLVLTNPGGLWAITASQLGTPDGKSAVNEFLYMICRHLKSGSGRIIEAMGTGIEAARVALAEAGQQPPVFIDNAVRFTVRFPRAEAADVVDVAWLAKFTSFGLSHAQKRLVLHLRGGGAVSNADYRELTGVDPVRARDDLQELVEAGLLERHGERRWTRYRLAEPYREL